MGIVSGILLVLIVIVVFAYGGSVIMGFVTDTSSAFKQAVSDRELQIPSAPVGTSACDLFITVQWREKNSSGFPFIEQILFTNVDGKTVKKTVSNCGIVAPVQNSLMTLLDFIGSGKAQPLEFVFPTQGITEGTYSMSFVLVDANGYEKKLPHYQNLPFKVPITTYENDYEQKLIFRDMQYGNYVLEMRPSEARWSDHGESQPYRQNISVP